MKLPNQPVVDFSYGLSYYSTATGKSIPLSPLGNRDVWGFDDGARALPAGIPDNKIVRQGIYTPDVGLRREPDHRVRPAARRTSGVPVNESGTPGSELERDARQPLRRTWASSPASRTPTRSSTSKRIGGFFRIAGDGELENTSDYHIQTGTPEGAARHRRQPVLPVQPEPADLTFENFYTHSGRDEGRFFQGINLDNAREYKNFRLQFIEEGLMANAIGGEHFFQSLVEQPSRLARELRARDA